MLLERRGKGQFFNPHSDPVLGIGVVGFIAMAVWLVVACGIAIWRRALPESGLQRAYLAAPVLAAAILWVS